MQLITLTQNSDRCWEVCSVFFNSRELNICSAEKVGSALSKSSTLGWILAIQFDNLFNCFLCPFLFLFLMCICLSNWLNSSTVFERRRDFVKHSVFVIFDRVHLQKKNSKIFAEIAKSLYGLYGCMKKTLLMKKLLSLCRIQFFA